jgi:hypothetical protein
MTGYPEGVGVEQCSRQMAVSGVTARVLSDLRGYDEEVRKA